MKIVRTNTIFNLLIMVILLLIIISGVESNQFIKHHDLTIGPTNSISKWEVEGAPQNVRIKGDLISIAPNVPRFALVSKAYALNNMLQSEQFVRVTGMVSKVSLIKLSYPNIWEGIEQSSLFYLWFENEQGKRFGVQHIQRLAGNIQLGKRKLIASIPSNAKSVHVGLILRNASSGYELHSVKVEMLTRTLLNLIATSVVALLCIIVAVLMIVKMYVTVGLVRLVVFLCAITTLVLGVFLSGNKIESFVLLIYSVLGIANDISGHPNLHNLQNVGHVVGFAVVSMLAWNSRERLNIRIGDMVFKLMVLVLFTEALQLHQIDRNPNIQDIGFNTLGVLLGTFVWFCAPLFLKSADIDETGKHI